MTELLTIARPYAKAAFMIAKENNASYSVWADFLKISALIMQQDDAQALLSDPQVSESTQLDMFKRLIDAVQANVNKHFKMQLNFENFLTILIQNEKLALLPFIATQFQELYAQAQDQLDAEVISAFPVSDEQQKLIKKALEKRFGQSVKLNVSIDPALIGGVIIRARDCVIDGSVQSQLVKLDRQLA